MSDTPDKINTEATNVPLSNIEIYTTEQNYKNAYAAAFIPKINRITVNGEQNRIDALIAHEAWHKRTHESDVHNLPMSLAQHHKLHIHDEISAYIVELMTVRQQYLEAKNETERNAIVNSTIGKDYNWYFDAIARGEIDPNKTDPKDPLKEEKFIYQGVKDIYSRVLSADHPVSEAYRKDQKNLTDATFNTTEFENLKQNDDNYKDALRTMYTIGGVNFGIFAERNDVDNLVPANIIEADKQIAAGQSREEIEKTLDIHLSKKERKQFAAQRLANQHTREEIEQLLTTDLSKEDKKLYKAALKQKDKDELKEQEQLARNYLRQTYDSPETIAVYDMSSPFIFFQNEKNNLPTTLQMQIDLSYREFEKRSKERLQESIQKIPDNIQQRQEALNIALDKRQTTSGEEQTQEQPSRENTPQNYIFRNQRGRS